MRNSMITRRIVLLTLTLLVSVNLQAVSKRGTTAASFLEIGIGARGTSMGNAYVAVADDVHSLYWNPAGLALMNKSEVSFIQTKWLAGIDFNNVSAAFPMGNLGTIGVALTSISVEEMDVRTIEKPEGTGEKFGATDFSATLGWGRSFTDRFSFGANVKYIEEQIWHMKASSVAVDLGTTFRTQFKDMKIGMSVTNFGNKMQLKGDDTLLKIDIAPDQEGNNSKINGHLDTDYWSLPLTFRVGVAADVFKIPHGKLTLAMDAAHPNNYAESISFGGEINIMDLAFLRAGQTFYLNDVDDDGNSFSPERFNLGGGINILLTRDLRFKLDLAYGDWGILSDVRRFSLSLEF
ncbi:MAG: PorV/PorQ family protein [Candidatus Marinimicrobia bacterium]|nr:PorV/PorQ family protein [Candidatus Neomarinimicrobiota bacterium]